MDVRTILEIESIEQRWFIDIMNRTYKEPTRVWNQSD